MYNIQTKILMLLFKINSHKKKYFDDFLNGYSLAVTFADWLTGLVFHTVTQTFIALVSPSVHCNKVCIRDYTSTAFSTTRISRNFSARFLWFKQLLWTSNDFYIEFGEIIAYHSIGMYSDLWSLLHVNKKVNFVSPHKILCRPSLYRYTKAQADWRGDCGADRSGDPLSNLGLVAQA